MRPVDRAGCYVPGAAAPLVSTALMTVVPGQGGRGARGRAGDRPGPRRPGAGRHPGRRRRWPAPTRSTGSAGRRPSRALAYGTESIRPVDVIVGPGTCPGRPGQARGRGPGLVGVPSAFAGPVRGRGRRRRRRPRPSWPPSTSSSRPSTAPTGWPGSSPGTRPWPTRSPRRSPGWSPRSPRRRHLEATLAEGGYAVLRRRRPGRWPWPTPSPPSTSSCSSTDPRRCCRWSATPAPCSAARWRPASIGDYLAGPNHVLPTYGSARFAGALRVDDFRKHIHVVTVADEGLWRRSAPTSRPWPTYEGLPAHAESIRLPAATRRAAVSDARRPAPTWRSMDGYHSPQVDVEVRLNTNEAPCPPPAGFLDAPGRGAGRRRLAPLPRPRLPRRCGPPSPSHHGVDPGAGVRGQRLQRGAADAVPHLRRARPHGGRVRAHLRAALPHRPHHRHRGGRGRARRRLLARPRRGPPACWREHAPGITFLCSPNNPTGMVEPEELVRTVARQAPGLVVVDEAYGQFAPWSALDLVDERRPARRHPHVLQDVVDGRGPARLPGRPRRGWSPSSTRSCCPTTSTRSSRPPARWRSTSRTRCGPGWRARRGAGPARRPPSPTCRSRCGRRAPTSSCSAPERGRRRRVAGPARPVGPRPQLLVAGPASTAACVSPIGTPAEDDAFLAALTEVLA